MLALQPEDAGAEFGAYVGVGEGVHADAREADHVAGDHGECGADVAGAEGGWGAGGA